MEKLRIRKLVRKIKQHMCLAKTFCPLSLLLLAATGYAQRTKPAQILTHSHNDYAQPIPFFSAYHSQMNSIEADVFLTGNELFVAHEFDQIVPGKTLKSVYLEPLYKLYKKNGNQPYLREERSLELVIDIKENYAQVIPVLIRQLQPYKDMIDPSVSKKPVKIVLSGDMPAPELYKNYPSYLSFDGRPGIAYTAEQLKRVAMISDDMHSYTEWNGKGTPAVADTLKLLKVVADAHRMKKPFRFWATQDSYNTWIELENLGVDWIGTDHPEILSAFYASRHKTEYINPVSYKAYQPEYKSDGKDLPLKNVILIIGDGMGLAQIQAALTANHGNLNLAGIRHIGLSLTKASNSGNTDSAAGGTALACGEKTNNRYVGMDSLGMPITNIPDTLDRFGIKSGVISSGDITDATPAAFYAHQPERSWSDKIAKDFLNSKVEILIGPNRKSFAENPDKTLMSGIKQKGFEFLRDLKELEQSKPGKKLVLLADSVTRPVLKGRGDMLKVSLEQTIRLLSASKKGFFIMAEGAQVDYGGHDNNLPYAVTELLDLDQTVGAALKYADQDGQTLVIVTADHETGGLTLLAADQRKGRILGNFSTNDHTNVMVPVFAYGPHADQFAGMYQNNEICHKIIQLMTASMQAASK
ncbi:alkaline phosphatase [Pedobacter hartonius]|uniref:Alkaline phosphatase n=1 Tax=Pedobacter hartonius TaxID=425514 RepID=A0A1H4G6M0_9SPHI|nr:alkaline phosphatase [Pedobacter hartonius]SEB04690.1 alkaline phosphatase [Pedobacter hartonius]